MISWYLNRIKTMSAIELPYRFHQLIQRKYEEYFCAGKKYRAQKRLGKSKCILNIAITHNDLFPDTISVFGKKWDYNKKTINWQQDVFTGNEFPLTFSKSINIRNNPDLSAKNVWEINRLQFLPQIAINYKITNDEKYLNQFIQITTSWIESNPYLLGVNWYSNIEINIRLINWAVCWEILNTETLILNNHKFEQFANEKWIPSIYQHCLYSVNNPSKYSSANNHLISEYAGLFIASSLWEFRESKKWIKYAKQGLEKEITKQHSNGINKEEAAEYIQFITDFFLLSFIVGKQTNNQFSEQYENTIKAIIEYIYTFTDCNGNFPKYGDEDDGKVIILSSNPHYNNFKSLLTSGAILFNDERYKSKSVGYDLKNQLLFGHTGLDLFDRINIKEFEQHASFYELEGHYIFRKNKKGKEIYLHFDAAPLGYLSIAAHGHSDALSFILSINGIPVFVDSGTYSYHVAEKWRKYFVSTLAHNTICIDGKNQAKQVGDTMWLDHYKCETKSILQTNDILSVEASHNGYKNIDHRREIIFNENSDTFIIKDDLTNRDKKEHEYKILFHLHPEIDISVLSPQKVMLSHSSGIKLALTIDGFDNIELAKGQEKPILGWYSESFMQKQPTTVIYSSKKTNLPILSNTKIKIYDY